MIDLVAQACGGGLGLSPSCAVEFSYRNASCTIFIVWRELRLDHELFIRGRHVSRDG